MEIRQTCFYHCKILKAFWSARYKQDKTRRVMWILKASFVFDNVLTIIDMTEISHGLLTWFRIKISQ